MKFQRGKDPKEILQIGIFSHRNFSSLTEARTWLMRNHVAILGLQELCYPHPTPEQYHQLKEYAKKWVTFEGDDKWKGDFIVDGVAKLYRDLNTIASGRY
jgi:hypothetical protein